MATVSASAGRSGVIRRLTGRVTWSVPGMTTKGPLSSWIGAASGAARLSWSGRATGRNGDQVGRRDVHRDELFCGREVDRQRLPLGNLDDGVVGRRNVVADTGQRPVPAGE